MRNPHFQTSGLRLFFDLCTKALSKYQWLNFFDKEAYGKLLRSLRKRAEHLMESGQELILPEATELPSEDLQYTSSSIDQKRLSPIGCPQQILLIYQTLKDLEEYLDTGDLRRLTFNSLAVLKDDMLKIIGWLRDIENADITHRFMMSYSGAVNHLRRARSNLQEAQGMFEQEYLDEKKAGRFFVTLKETRSNIESALEYFGNE